MISKKDIIKMTRNIFRRSQGYKERKIINPRREWIIGIGLFVATITFGSVLNMQSYFYFNHLELLVSDTTKPVKKYKSELSKAAMELYVKKSDAFNKLLKSKNKTNNIQIKKQLTDVDSSDKVSTTTSNGRSLLVPRLR